MAATYSSLVGVPVGGKYEVRKILGVGGMGVVCEAIHLDLGKKVAIKLIDKSMKESELIVARFRREARALGQIQSEHIVDVFDVGADARVGLYMVMEHLPGEDLQTKLERDKRVDVTTGVMLAHQIARGLAKAHAAGVIHRDLKPANVFLTTRDNGGMLVKLLDFGVSKLLGEAGGARITGSGAPIGTPLYMSPEQAEGKDDTDGRADIWSLGAVLYEALSGDPPFADRGSYHGTIVGILTSRPRLLHDAAPWVPPALAEVVDAMLVHDRSARIKDAAAVTKRLLDAYPAVLPDGTGRHTAVIVPQATSPVDAVGDTEIFTSSAFRDAVKETGREAKGSGPGGKAEAKSGPGATPSSNPALVDAEDSKRTVPDLSSIPGAPDDGTRTAAATPIDMGRDAATSSPPTPSGIAPKGSNRPKTDPLPLASPSSSASGVAMPGTPPIIEPLPVSEISPDTTRDDLLAVRAERRRRMTLAGIAIGILAVAVGGFFMGRHAGPDFATTPLAPTTAPPPVIGTATPTPTETAAIDPSATTPVTTPSALPSASASATEAAAATIETAPPPSPAPRATTRRRFRPPTPPTSAAATATDPPTAPAEEAPAPAPQDNPYVDPK